MYDLIANTAAEEYGHIELVAAAINTMLTGSAGGDGDGGSLRDVKGTRNTQQFIAGGAGLDEVARGENVVAAPGLAAAHPARRAPQALPLLAGRLPRDHRRLQRPHPETGEDLTVINHAPEGAPPADLPPQMAVFAPDYAAAEIAEIAQKLRQAAGRPKEPTGVVAGNGGGLVDKVKNAVS